MGCLSKLNDFCASLKWISRDLNPVAHDKAAEVRSMYLAAF